jgi:hypothetical protein
MQWTFRAKRSLLVARDTADGLGEAVASALSSWADRFRQGTNSLSDQSAAFGKDAARYGTAALSQISKETEQRPYRGRIGRWHPYRNGSEQSVSVAYLNSRERPGNGSDPKLGGC